MRFRDRLDAGRLLAKQLSAYRGQRDVLVSGLARGGVPMGRAIADALDVSLDVLIVRKLGVPWQPELGFGAVAEGGVSFVDEEVVRECRISPTEVEAIIAREQGEIERRSRIYRGRKPPTRVQGRIVIVADDGLATGATMIAAVRALRKLGALRIVVAVPVGPKSTCDTLRAEADEVVCLYNPRSFHAVGAWYEDFSQVTDREVQAALSTPAKKVSGQ